MGDSHTALVLGGKYFGNYLFGCSCRKHPESNDALSSFCDDTCNYRCHQYNNEWLCFIRQFTTTIDYSQTALWNVRVSFFDLGWPETQVLTSRDDHFSFVSQHQIDLEKRWRSREGKFWRMWGLMCRWGCESVCWSVTHRSTTLIKCRLLSSDSPQRGSTQAKPRDWQDKTFFNCMKRGRGYI